MIKTKSDYFTDAAMCTADVILIFTIYKIWTVIENISGFGVRLMPWVGVVLFIYAANAFLHKKGAYVNTILMFNVLGAIFTAAMGIFVITSPDTNTGLLSIVFKTGIFMFTSLWAYNIAKNGVLANQLMLHLEFTFVVLLLTLFLGQTESFSVLPFPFHVLLAVVIMFFALIIKRTDTQNSAKTYGSRSLGAITVIAVVFVSTAVTFIFSFLFYNIIRQIIEKGIKGGGDLLTILKNVLISLLNFLASLFPQQEMTSIPMEAAPSVSYTAEEMPDLGINIAPYAIAAIIIIAAAIIIYFLVRNKNKLLKRTEKTEVIAENIEKTDTSHIFKAIFDKIRRIYKTILFRIKNRNTIKGLYWKMYDFGKVNKMPVIDGESHKEYINRITSTDGLFNENEKNSLLKLSDLFTLYFYSPKAPETDTKFIKECRKILNKKIKIQKEERIQQKNEDAALLS